MAGRTWSPHQVSGDRDRIVLYVSAGDDRPRILGSAEKRRTGEPSSPSLVTEVPSGKKPRLKEALPRKQGQAVGELLECLLVVAVEPRSVLLDRKAVADLASTT